MRGLIFDGKLSLETSLPIPESSSPGALIRIHKAGVCNTDLELVKGYMNFSGILGHEFVGTVTAGPAQWRDARVVGEINVACGKCRFCRHDVPSQCLDRTTVGIDRHPGAFADYLPLPVRNLHRVPENVSDDEAVFVEPLAAALQVTEAVSISPRDRIVVIGAGKLGLLVAQVLGLTGADLCVVTRREKQEKLLANWNIATCREGELESNSAQFVVDCTGEQSGFAAALDIVEPRGSILLKSTYHGLPQIDMTRVVVDEVRIIGSRCGPFDAALRLLASGKVDVQSLIEDRFALDNAIDALGEAAQPGKLKVLLDVVQH